RDLQRPPIVDERLRVVVLVPSHRHSLSARALADQGQRRLPFRRAGRLGEARVHHQSMTVLHQHMPQDAQRRLLARGLLGPPGFRIRRRRMRGIRPALARNSTRGLPGSSGGGTGAASVFRLKLFWPAQASISVPSTVTCSSDNRRWALACASTCSKNAVATLPASKRSRFLVKTVTAHTGASRSRPTNQRNSRESCNSSIKSLSLRRLSS